MLSWRKADEGSESRVRCPVCDRENTSMLCPQCGFDSSKDYGKYPTLSPVGKSTAVSVLRQDRQKRVGPAPVKTTHVPAEKKRKTAGRIPNWFAAAACAVMMLLGIWIGTGLKGGESGSTEAFESVPLNLKEETTVLPAADWRLNVLRSDQVRYDSADVWAWDDEARIWPVFNSKYRREQISSVTFRNTLDDMPDDAWDVSETGNGRVMAWVKPNGDFYDLYIAAEGGVNTGDACRDLFAGYVNVQQISFGDSFHTNGALDMSRMFLGCHKLSSLELDNFETADVHSMQAMFCESDELVSLDLRKFDTGSVRDMGSMFRACRSLRTLELSSFDTAQVRDMNRMFRGCVSLQSLELSNFDTAQVRDMTGMFYECISMSPPDLSSFDTSMVENMCGMFQNCSTWKKLDLRNFDTANVQDMTAMFSGCETLTRLKLGDDFVSTNAYTADMFADCPAGADYQHLVH